MTIQPLAEVTSYDDLLEALRTRKAELDISNLALDEISGLASGHSSKIFCRMKNLGPVSLGLLLGALGVRLVLIQDEEALARVRGRFVRRYASRHMHQRQQAAIP